MCPPQLQTNLTALQTTPAYWVVNLGSPQPSPLVLTTRTRIVQSGLLDVLKVITRAKWCQFSGFDRFECLVLVSMGAQQLHVHGGWQDRLRHDPAERRNVQTVFMELLEALNENAEGQYFAISIGSGTYPMFQIPTRTGLVLILLTLLLVSGQPWASIEASRPSLRTLWTLWMLTLRT